MLSSTELESPGSPQPTTPTEEESGSSLVRSMPHISSLPPFSFPKFFFSIGFNRLIPQLNPRLIMTTYIITPVTWFWDSLLRLFYSAINTVDVLGNGDRQELRIKPYEPKSGCQEGEEQCAVCLCQIREGEQIRELRCDHLFHRVCLDRWMHEYKHATCPLCRGLLARRRNGSELGVQELELRFCSFSSGDHTNWWLR